jgi:hypothetical protein
MLTISYKQLFNEVCRAAVTDPASLSEFDRVIFTDAINTEMRRSWMWSHWPEWTQVSALLQSSVIEEDGATWTIFPLNSEQRRGRVWGIYALEDVARSRELRFFGNGTIIKVEGAWEKVFAQWQAAAPEFTAERWVASKAYAPGETVLYLAAGGVPVGADGNCYVCVGADGPGAAPNLEQKWVAVPVPETLHEVLRLGAAAEIFFARGDREAYFQFTNEATAARLRAMDLFSPVRRARR